MFDLIFCATDDLQLCFNAPSVWSGGKGRSFIVISIWNAAKIHEGQPSSIFFQ